MSKQSFIEKPLGAQCESIRMYFESEGNSSSYGNFRVSRKGKGEVIYASHPALDSGVILIKDQPIQNCRIFYILSSDNQGLVNWFHTEA